MNVHELLNDYLNKEVVAKTGQPLPTLDEPLLDPEGGVVDSVTLWPLIVFVETHLGIKVEDIELVPENFQSLRALINYIESKKSESDS